MPCDDCVTMHKIPKAMPPTKHMHTTTATFASCCSKIRKSSGLRSHDINQSGCGARYQIQHIRYVSDSTVCVFFYFATVAESPNRQLKMASEKILITCSGLICLLWKLVQHDPIQKKNRTYWAENYYSQYSWKVTLRFAPIGSEMKFPRSFASKKCPKLC